MEIVERLWAKTDPKKTAEKPNIPWFEPSLKGKPNGVKLNVSTILTHLLYIKFGIVVLNE